MIASFFFVLTVREKKAFVCVCVYFMFIFSVFGSDICVTMQFTVARLAHNSLLRLIHISLPIAFSYIRRSLEVHYSCTLQTVSRLNVGEYNNG
jgi:hypothetical protein